MEIGGQIKVQQKKQQESEVAKPYRSDPVFTGPAGLEVRIPGQALTRLHDS